MADEGEDIGWCDECGAAGVVYYVDNPGPTKAEQYKQNTYCKRHARLPVVMDKEAFDMVFEKAGVPHQKRFRPWESILGILSFSKEHHKQATQELMS